jgi:hypothetical protein
VNYYELYDKNEIKTMFVIFLVYAASVSHKPNYLEGDFDETSFSFWGDWTGRCFTDLFLRSHPCRPDS